MNMMKILVGKMGATGPSYYFNNSKPYTIEQMGCHELIGKI
jgi:hypothetical protein